MEMGEQELITDYFIRAETTCNALKTAGEIISDSFLMAIIRKGLPNQ